LTRLTPNGQVLKSSGYINIDEEFLIECKNYNKKVDVTFIGKFATLLHAHNQKFGIMISNKGITGKGWNDALGLTKKIFLKENILIISLTIKDFRRMLDFSLFEVIEAKKMEIITDTKYEHFLSAHPSLT
ncbi:restriction endonuclease, partial [Lysinibacillus capsici]|uniref:restriction endonuclease n=1 Tax=Lysinibacillus capsici TaxID=2115968 RepID=UPI001C0F4DE3